MADAPNPPNAPGFGTTLQYAQTDYSSPVAVTGLIDIEPPAGKIDSVQNSNFATTDQVHTSQPGWEKPGVMKVTILWDHTQVAAIKALKRKMKGWIITTNDGTEIGGATSSTIKFQGFITGDGMKVPMEKLDTYEFEIQQSGAETFTAGT